MISVNNNISVAKFALGVPIKERDEGCIALCALSRQRLAIKLSRPKKLVLTAKDLKKQLLHPSSSTHNIAQGLMNLSGARKLDSDGFVSYDPRLDKQVDLSTIDFKDLKELTYSDIDDVKLDPKAEAIHKKAKEICEILDPNNYLFVTDSILLLSFICIETNIDFIEPLGSNPDDLKELICFLDSLIENPNITASQYAKLETIISSLSEEITRIFEENKKESVAEEVNLKKI